MPVLLPLMSLCQEAPGECSLIPAPYQRFTYIFDVQDSLCACHEVSQGDGTCSLLIFADDKGQPHVFLACQLQGCADTVPGDIYLYYWKRLSLFCSVCTDGTRHLQGIGHILDIYRND